mgnify:FL=1
MSPLNCPYSNDTNEIMKTFTLTFTEAELETIGAAMDDYMCYADDEFANQDDLIGGISVADRVNSINDKINAVFN